MRGIGGIVAAAALALAACGGGDEEAGATLDIVDPGIDVADFDPEAVGLQDFRPGEDGEVLALGERVRADAVGYGIVDWFDGARTFVYDGAVYELRTLDREAERPVVRTRLDVGRTFHSVREDTVQEFAVETAVGTAAVRGTRFTVGCDDACAFAVLDGAVDVTTSIGVEVELLAGESVVVRPDGVPEEVLPLQFVDGGTARALRIEQEAGVEFTFTIDFAAGGRAGGEDGAEGGRYGPPPGSGRDDGDPSTARLDGVYDLALTITESTEPAQVGTTQTRVYTFSPSCDAGPCGGDWDPGDGRPIRFTWTGRGYAAAFVGREALTEAACNEAGVPSWIEDFVFEVTPTDFERIDDRRVVTAFDFAWDTTLTRPAQVDATGCHAWPSQQATVEGSATRRG